MADRRSHGLSPAMRQLATPLGRCVLPLLLATLLLVPAASFAQGGDLPPRPDLTPTPAPYTPHVPGPPSGATIRLTVQPGAAGGSAALAGVWTVVQWEDAAGTWHDVDGWRGHLDDAGAYTKTWWVNAADYGRGPFRWVTYEGEGGPELAASESFDLPGASRQIVDVTVAMP